MHYGIQTWALGLNFAVPLPSFMTLAKSLHLIILNYKTTVMKVYEMKYIKCSAQYLLFKLLLKLYQ